MIFQDINNPLVKDFIWQKRIKIRQIAVKKATLRKEPDYIYPVILLSVVSCLIPLLFVYSGKSNFAATVFVILGTVTNYVGSKLSIPFYTPYLEEAIIEYEDKI